ncbi:hypothetical protein HDU67_003211 [Dinochytrium kinnereticum]|nr:hypothetical protein HDU67_003211 [Dinochytrium kinnereticum]
MSFRTGRRTTLHEGDWRLSLSRFFLNVARLAVVVAGPAWLGYMEYSARETSLAMREAGKMLVGIPGDSLNSVDLEPLVGKLVQVSSRNVRPEVIRDGDFGLTFSRAVKVARVPEYCQWTESYTDEEVRYTDGDGEERVETIRRYYYYKGWQSSTVPSIFFDQPAAHHNPQRDPFPGYTRTSSSALFGDFRVAKSILTKATPLRQKRDYTPSDLRAGFDTSPAATTATTVNRFTYVGGGYFFSAYQPSTAERILRMAGTWLEGSILDFQIGDLFSACQAGDVRISFDVVEVPESGASVLGQLMNVRGDIGLFTTSRGYKIGLYARDASTPPREILRREMISTRWSLLLSRIGILAWSLYMLSHSSGLTSRRHPNGPRDARGYAMWGLQSSGLALACMSGLGLLLWMNAASIVGLVIAAGLFWAGRPDGFGEVLRGGRALRGVGMVWVEWVRKAFVGSPPFAASQSESKAAGGKKAL